MSARVLFAGVTLFVASSVRAQVPGAYIVTRLGVDTVGIERYTRTKDKLEGDLTLRYPRVRTFHYVAALGPRGEIKSMTTTVRRPNTDANAPAMTEVVVNLADTVAVVEVQRAGKRDSAASARKIYHGGVVPTLFTEPAAYGPYEQLLASSRLGKDSVAYALVGPGGGPVPAIILRRGKADTVTFTSTFFPNWIEVARVDSRGRILSLDASATTVKTVAERVPNLDFDAVVRGWAAAETARGGAAQMSPPDTVRANVAGANIEVAYSRPAKRGRVIFGRVVPWNEVWRTGANAATQLTTDRDLVIAGTTVPAGKYTLFTVPTPTGGKLIISKETGQWGTDYHADKDLTRVDLNTKTLSQPVESFVIGVAPQGNGGLLRLAWDDREYTVPFTVK